ncbi:hypothetical protein POTOM_000077 [Populus tomentosa]|uniref:Uncharacterized protein n=1 Tax=Populus tomentosa TaxID=118781 RepID=A0A8X8AUC4_POPTO|nr:hypothetical protein POTOM_000077 [Populus tomentosa]
MVGSIMASSSSILTSPKQKNSPSIDAVLGNDDPVTEILLRVPAKALFSPELPSFSRKLPTHKYVSLDGKSLAYFSYDFLDFDPSNNPGYIYVSQACNGLLLCSKCRWDLPERSQPINYIFNPTTRQFAMLPPPPDDGQFFDSIQLVFDPSESSCYRVVCTQLFTSELKIYVYLSETKDWKLALREPRKNALRPFRGLHFLRIGVLAGNQNPDDLNIEDEDLAASPFSAEKGSVRLLSFIDGDNNEGPLLVMGILGEIISYCFKDETFKKILRLPFKHATCYAFSYTETMNLLNIPAFSILIDISYSCSTIMEDGDLTADPIASVLLIMVSAPRPGPSTFTPSEQWLLMTATSLICGFLGYVVYDAVMATASEMLQRLLVISPLILIIAVHLLSAGSRFSIPIPGSEPGAIHRAGGSPWGVAFVLLLLVFLISYQPSLHGLIF